MILPIPFIKTDLYQSTISITSLAVFAEVFVTYLVIKNQKVFEKAVVIITLLSGPMHLILSIISKNTVKQIVGIVISSVGIICFGYLLKYRGKYSFGQSTTFRNCLYGIISGIVLCIIIDIVFILYGREINITNISSKLLNRILIFIVMLFSAPVYEEPLFRSPILLVQTKKMKIILMLGQTFLFFIAHAYYYGMRNIELFYLVPLCGFTFGLITYKTKSILPSMISHDIVNTFYQLIF